MRSDVWKNAEQLREEQRSFVVVTLVSVRGGAPQEPGAKIIVTEEGLHWGTVGGGKIEAHCVRYAQELLRGRRGEPDLQTWNLQRDITMTCGGEVTMLFETELVDPWQIAVYGAGHTAQALVRVLLPMRCRIVCLDTREEWCARLPRGESPRFTVRCETDLPATVRDFDARTSFVVMTQGHATDVPILEEIFRRFPDAHYVGVMGSKVKAIKMRADLRARGISEDVLERLHSPIGLDVGGNDPSEIAVSVAAQLLQLRG